MTGSRLTVWLALAALAIWMIGPAVKTAVERAMFVAAGGQIIDAVTTAPDLRQLAPRAQTEVVPVQPIDRSKTHSSKPRKAGKQHRGVLLPTDEDLAPVVMGSPQQFGPRSRPPQASDKAARPPARARVRKERRRE